MSVIRLGHRRARPDPRRPAGPARQKRAAAIGAWRELSGYDHHEHAAAGHKLAAGYQALERAYRQRETVFAQTMADRADWDQATRAQRQPAIAADAKLRRRHPGQYFRPLRSTEPEPATQSQRDELTLTPDQPPGEIDQWITADRVRTRPGNGRTSNWTFDLLAQRPGGQRSA